MPVRAARIAHEADRDPQQTDAKQSVTAHETSEVIDNLARTRCDGSGNGCPPKRKPYAGQTLTR